MTARSLVRGLTDPELVRVMDVSQAKIANYLKTDCAILAGPEYRIVKACEREILARVKHNRWAKVAARRQLG